MAQSVKEQVLSSLIATTDFLSGEQLKNELGVSRTSIWKSINKLKEEGYQIESITNRGYRLIEKPGQLVESLLTHDLRQRGFEEVVVLDTVDSTNLEAKRRALSVKGKGLYISKEQTQGKGRRGRTWQSPKGSGLYMSLLLRPNIEPAVASMVTLLAGLAVCNSIKDLFGIETLIKWPNDLVVNKKKLCGILTEMNTEVDFVNYIVVGIGMNLFQTEFPEEVALMATSLIESSNGTLNSLKIDQHQLIIRIIDYLLAYLLQLEKNQNISFIRDEYEQKCVNIKGDLKLESNSVVTTCVGKGISDQGHLMVMDAEGVLREVSSGEVSVRGIYGYV